MVGILLLSHGKMAEGLLDSASMFFADKLEQIDVLAYNEEISLDDFDEQLKNKLDALNDGSGVFVLTDILSGTPFNRMVPHIGKDVYVFSGTNLNMLLTILIARNNCETVSDLAVDDLLNEGKEGIVFANRLMEEMQ